MGEASGQSRDTRATRLGWRKELAAGPRFIDDQMYRLTYYEEKVPVIASLCHLLMGKTGTVYAFLSFSTDKASPDLHLHPSLRGVFINVVLKRLVLRRLQPGHPPGAAFGPRFLF